jgi:hypothetical protein
MSHMKADPLPPASPSDKGSPGLCTNYWLISDAELETLSSTTCEF